jgi:hypothetical protein
MLFLFVIFMALTAVGCGNQVTVPDPKTLGQEAPIFPQDLGNLTIGVQPAFPLDINGQSYENIEEFATDLIQQLPGKLASVGIDPIIAKRASIITDLTINKAFKDASVSLLADDMPYSSVLNEERTATFPTMSKHYSVRVVQRIIVNSINPVCINLIGQSKDSPIVKNFRLQITATSCNNTATGFNMPSAILYKGMPIDQAIKAAPGDYLQDVSEGDVYTLCLTYQSVLDKTRFCSDYSSGPYNGLPGMHPGCYCELEFQNQRLTKVRGINLRYVDVSLLN